MFVLTQELFFIPVVDVGAKFDHEKKRYDHHQREFTETLSSLKPELGDKYKIK